MTDAQAFAVRRSACAVLMLLAAEVCGSAATGWRYWDADYDHHNALLGFYMRMVEER